MPRCREGRARQLGHAIAGEALHLDIVNGKEHSREVEVLFAGDACISREVVDTLHVASEALRVRVTHQSVCKVLGIHRPCTHAPSHFCHL